MRHPNALTTFSAPRVAYKGYVIERWGGFENVYPAQKGSPLVPTRQRVWETNTVGKAKAWIDKNPLPLVLKPCFDVFLIPDIKTLTM